MNMSTYNKVILFLQEMILKKFSGRIIIVFHQGGIRGIKKSSEEDVKL